MPRVEHPVKKIETGYAFTERMSRIYYGQSQWYAANGDPDMAARTKRYAQGLEIQAAALKRKAKSAITSQPGRKIKTRRVRRRRIN